MKEFVSDVEAAEVDPDDGIKFKVDGREMTAYRPTEGQIALVSLTLGRHASQMDQAAGVIDFFFNVLDEDSQVYMAEGLSSRTNMIPLSTIVDILYYLLEEWTGRPFQSPSASTPSPPNGGRKSTPATTRRTSSRSALAAS